MTDEYLTGPKGTYRLLQRIGSGGMGVVHLALDEDGRTIAVKELHPGLIDDDMLRRLEREVTSMRQVSSPYVAEIRDADVRGERPFVATRYVQGRPLDLTVRERGPLTGPQLVHVARHLAAALQAIHDAGIIHRDLKPSNVMLSEGMPVIIDFGIAQAIDATRLTHTGVVVGTPGYLAPEIVNGGEAEMPSDVFAWAATIAYAATGRSPFGTGPAEVIFFRVAGGQSDLHGVPEPLIPILRSALSRDPGSRPTAGELADRLAAVRLDTPTGEHDAGAAAAQGAGPSSEPEPGTSGTGDLRAAEAAAAAAAGAAAMPGAPEAGTPGTGAAGPGVPESGTPDVVRPAGAPAAGETGDMPASPITGGAGEQTTEPVHNGAPPDRLDTGHSWPPSAPTQSAPGIPPQPPRTGQAPGGPPPGQASQWGSGPGQQGRPGQPQQGGPGPGYPSGPQAGQAFAPGSQPGQPGQVRPGQGGPGPGHPSGPQAGRPGPPGQPQAGQPSQPQAPYGGQPVPPLPAGQVEAALPGGPAAGQAGQPAQAHRLGIGLGVLTVAGATALTYVLPTLGVLITLAGLIALGTRDRIRPYGTQPVGGALVAAGWRGGAAIAGAGVVAWLVETVFELVAKPMVTGGQSTGLAAVPATTVLAAFVALAVLLACAVPRWRAPTRALAVLVSAGGGTPVLRYVVMAVAALAIVAALFTPAPAWFPLPITASASLGDVLK